MNYNNYKRKLEFSGRNPYTQSNQQHQQQPPHLERQLTIPEMYGQGPKPNMNRFQGNNNRMMVEYNRSEQATTPRSSTMMPSFGEQNPSYFGYEEPNQQYFNEDYSPMMYQPINKQRKIQNMPYYGVPGFYCPPRDNFGPAMYEDAEDNPRQMYSSTGYTPTPIYNKNRPTATITRPSQENDYDVPIPNKQNYIPIQTPNKSSLNVHQIPSKNTGPVYNKSTINTTSKTPNKTPAKIISQTPVKSIENTPFKQGTKSTTEKAEKPKIKEIVTGTRIFSGGVNKVLKWEPLSHNGHMLFEVIALLKTLNEKTTHKELLLRDETGGPVLQILFYEIDRELCELKIGEYVRIVGSFIGKTRMQAYSVRPSSKLEYTCLQRISFVCNRIANEILKP